MQSAQLPQSLSEEGTRTRTIRAMERFGVRRETTAAAGEANLRGRAQAVTPASPGWHAGAISAREPGYSLSAEMMSAAEHVLSVLKPRVTFEEAQVASRALMPPQQVSEILDFLQERGFVRVTVVQNRLRYQAITGQDPHRLLA